MHRVRGQVGALDPSSAADYNLQLKLGASTPRGGSLAPWLGGGEKLNAAAPLGDASNHLVPSASPSAALAHLSHAEKLQRMRELRQSAMDSPRR